MTGTDTGAGKTYVSALVIQALRAEGVDAVGYKPICCGGREDAYTLLSASARAWNSMRSIHVTCARQQLPMWRLCLRMQSSSLSL